MKFKVELINIGREQICQVYEQEANSEQELARLVFEKVKGFLISSDVSLEPDRDDETVWNLYAGYRLVGEVKIKEEAKKIEKENERK